MTKTKSPTGFGGNFKLFPAMKERISHHFEWRSYSWAILFVVLSAFVVLNASPSIGHYVADENDAQFLLQGSQVLFGKIPGADLLMPVGFLPAFVSAFAQWVFGGPAGVTWLGAAGYALCLGLTVDILRRRTVSVWVAVIIVIFGTLCIPYERFFRWQQWLMPLVSIALTDRLLLSNKRTASGLWMFGAFLAIHLLYRFDQGLATLVATIPAIGLVVWFGGEGGRPNFRILQHIIIGFAAVPMAWAGYLLAVGGSIAINLSIAVDLLLHGAHIARIGQGALMVQMAFVAMGACYVYVMFIGCRKIFSGGQRELSDGGLAITVGLAGICAMPSLIYYPNTFHVQFGLGTLLIALGLLFSPPVDRFRLLAGVVVSGIVLGLIAPWAYPPLWSNKFIAKIEKMNDVASAPAGHPLGPLILAARASTSPGSEVFIVPRSMDSNILYFVQRPVATYDLILNPGLIGHRTLFPLNLDRVRQNRPKTAILYRAALKAPGMDGWRDLIESNYPTIVFDDGIYEVRKLSM